MDISFLTHSHLSLDQKLTNLKRAHSALEGSGDEAGLDLVAESVHALKAAIEEHVEQEESRLLPTARDILGDLPEMVRIERQHSGLKARIAALAALSSEPHRDAELLGRLIEEFAEAYSEHGMTEADFLDTAISMISPSAFSDG